jgi:hypothetical protein
VKKSLQQYHLHHRTLPARIVIMKTSRFEKEEAEGFAAARFVLQHRFDPPKRHTRSARIVITIEEALG